MFFELRYSENIYSTKLQMKGSLLGSVLMPHFLGNNIILLIKVYLNLFKRLTFNLESICLVIIIT